MVRNKTNKNKSKVGSSSFCPKNENVSTNRFGSFSVYSSSSPDDEQVTQQVSEREKDQNSKSFEDEDVDAGEKFEQVQNKKDKEIQKKINIVNSEFNKFKEDVLKELDKNVNLSIDDVCLRTNEALQNTLRTIGDEGKKRSMGREYSEVELFDESKNYMKRGRLLESSEFLWFTFSCAVSRLFAKLKIDITSHVATNILTNCLINACKGRKSIIDIGRKRANAAHRASYSVVVLEKLKGQILVMEDFIEEMNNIKLNDVKKSFEELKNEDDQLSDMNFGTCKIYNNKHTAFVFGASFDFDFSADIVNSKKYSVKN